MKPDQISLECRKWLLACDEFRFVLDEQRAYVIPEYIRENIDELIEKIDQAKDYAANIGGCY